MQALQLQPKTINTVSVMLIYKYGSGTDWRPFPKRQQQADTTGGGCSRCSKHAGRLYLAMNS